MQPAVQQFIEFYEALGASNTVDLSPVYAHNIEFIDPVHRMQGLDQLDQYFNSLMQNVAELKFSINHVDEIDGQAYLQWIMSYRHPRLAGGTMIEVSGISHIRFDGKITYHRDYYDLGEMVYEHVPLYGWFTRALKSRLSR